VLARALIGKLGFGREFDNNADPLLTHILAFCKARKYIKVSEAISLLRQNPTTATAV
jgi:hypothetical protein